jgi:hypothetical protein
MQFHDAILGNKDTPSVFSRIPIFKSISYNSEKMKKLHFVSIPTLQLLRLHTIGWEVDHLYSMEILMEIY